MPWKTPIGHVRALTSPHFDQWGEENAFRRGARVVARSNEHLDAGDPERTARSQFRRFPATDPPPAI